MGFPGGSYGKETICNAGDLDSIPGLRRYSGEENGNPLWYSCLQNPMNRDVWRATDHLVAKSQTWLSKKHTKSQAVSTYDGKDEKMCVIYKYHGKLLDKQLFKL